MENDEILKWRFDVNAFRLLGKELITDKITAIFELVKNSYDANSQNVHIYFFNVGVFSNNSQIIVQDDGQGMTFEDVRDKWMVVGTSHKRHNTHSPAPYNRKYVGSKGVGRFAVDKLGAKFELSTKVEGEENELHLNINWDKYETLTQQADKLNLFTDVDNTYQYKKVSTGLHGTKLIINQLHHVWTEKDVERLSKELAKLVSPFYPQAYPFNIHIYSNEYPNFKGNSLVADAIVHATEEIILEANQTEGWQEILKFNYLTKELYKEKINIESFGPVKFRIYYFNSQAKGYYQSYFKNKKAQIDGLKIYRDGLLATPFIQIETSHYRKKDILGLETMANFLSDKGIKRIYARDYIGIMDITQKDNPHIIDVTDRQDFLDNQEYKELKDFVFAQLKAVGELKAYEDEIATKQAEELLGNAKNTAKDFVKTITSLIKENPALKEPLNQLLEESRKNAETISSSEKRLREELKEKEEIIETQRSVMGLQMFAAEIAHAVLTPLKDIAMDSELFKNEYPNLDYDEDYKIAAKRMFLRSQQLRDIFEHMLSYIEKKNIRYRKFDLKESIKHYFYSYEKDFKLEKIHSEVLINESMPFSSVENFIFEIVQNLIDNAVKALKNTEQKQIKLSGQVIENRYEFVFSDNGTGIPKENQSQIFNAFFTTTENEGGKGLGLYIVKTRIKSLKGDIELITPEFGVGTSFKFYLPFKSNK